VRRCARWQASSGTPTPRPPPSLRRMPLAVKVNEVAYPIPVGLLRAAAEMPGANRLAEAIDKFLLLDRCQTRIGRWIRDLTHWILTIIVPVYAYSTITT